MGRAPGCDPRSRGSESLAHRQESPARGRVLRTASSDRSAMGPNRAQFPLQIPSLTGRASAWQPRRPSLNASRDRRTWPTPVLPPTTYRAKSPSTRSCWRRSSRASFARSDDRLSAGTIQIASVVGLPTGLRFLHPGNRRLRSETPVPAIAHMICQSCGAHSEGPASPSASSVSSCRCGGSRQVVRIVRHARGALSASLEELERSVQERASDETLTPGPRVL